jgi:hypothetical protein
MSRDDELWIPLVDEPIGSFVDELLAEHDDLAKTVDSPRRLLAFRTFSYLRVGMLLGRLLVERDLETPEDGPSWVEQLLEDPGVRGEALAEVSAVVDEIAADPVYAGDGPLGPDDAERERFREFAKRHLSPTSDA